MLVKIKLAGVLDAVTAVAEIDGVKVHFKYLVFGVALFKVSREFDFFHLARIGALAA